MSQKSTIPRAFTVNNCTKSNCIGTVDLTTYLGLHYDAKRRGPESFKRFVNVAYQNCYQNCVTQKIPKNIKKPICDWGKPSNR